tara:strand:- start:15 stop:1955 length:1941 start_codon:yes stop_codon:yes gene_type:complete
MSNSGKVWDIREVYKKQRGNQWSLGSGKGFYIAGTTPTAVGDITTININTTGNASDFGGDVLASQGGGGKGSNAGSPTRIIYGGGITAPVSPANTSSDQISYFVPTHSGNSADFGDLTNRRNSLASLSNNTRALFGGGYDYAGAPAPSGTNKDIIDFITIQSLGNAVDFGNLVSAKQNMAACSSTTRGVFLGGFGPSSPHHLDEIDFVTIASAGNATDFGNLTAARSTFAADSNNIRGITGGGNPGPYAGGELITIATTGNATDWGDLTATRRDLGSTGNQIRQTWGGGAAPSISNIIDFVTQASLGNATDFGDLTVANRGNAGSSDSHGGLELGFFPRESVNYMPGSGRGLFAGYHAPSHSNSIDLVTIPTLGNSSDFGNLTVARGRGGAASSLTRLIVFGGETPSSGVSDVIDSVEFVSQGNAADFGNLSVTRYQLGGLSNQTRGVNCGGYHGTPGVFFNTIDYVTIATAGNASDFGDLSGTRGSCGTTSSSTRGLIMGGRTPSNTNIIEYITIGSTSNVTDFGDLTDVTSTNAGASSATRGLSAGGLNPGDSAGVNTIEYITIASTSNATNFGDLTVARYIVAGMSNSLRAVFGGGKAPSDSNVMDYVTIASTGNAADFGDLITASAGITEGQCSDSHGGLQA